MTEQEERYHFIEWLKGFIEKDGINQPSFGLAVELRLIWGEKEFGNKSFKRRADDLANEVQQECFDIPAWIYILRHRIKAMEPDSAKREHWLRTLDSVCKDAFNAWIKMGRLHDQLVDLEDAAAERK